MQLSSSRSAGVFSIMNEEISNLLIKFAASFFISPEEHGTYGMR